MCNTKTVKYNNEVGKIRERKNQIKVYLSDEELERIKYKVSKSGLSQSDYMRKMLLSQKIIVVEGLEEFTLDLRRIGNNLNQLTRAVHQGKLFVGDELDTLIMEVDKIWQSLKSLKGGKV